MFKKVLMILTVVLTSNVFAEEKTDYPELQVTPRASERLGLESEYERVKPYAFQSAISASALTTLITAVTHDTDLSKDSESQAKNAGMIVGAGWLALNMWMGYQYSGYTSAANKINALPAKTAREQLIKERMAEEEINHLGRIGKTMKWGSFVTNFLAGTYMGSKAKKDSKSQVYSGLTMVASFLPIIFSNHFEDVATEQQQYKKKIFGTISSNFLLQDPVTNKWVPGVGFVATF
jgi:hypothetical protein